MAGYGALWRARLTVLRPGNAAMAATGVLVGLVHAAGRLGGPGAVGPATWVGAPLAAFLVTAAGNVLNDLVDRDLDRAAHPGRPLASGVLSVRDAATFASLLLGLGLLEAFLAGGVPTLVFAAGVALALVAYERWLKATPLLGNVTVALLVAATFLFGASAAGALSGPRGASAPLWGLAAMAFLVNVARELWKDLEDVDADRAVRRTFPARFGRRSTNGLCLATVGGAVALSALVAGRVDRPAAARIVLLLADLVFLWALARGLGDPAAGQRWLKAAMLLALAAFLAGFLADALDAQGSLQ